ncbi:MAG: hypothetical protein HC837_03980 [Chloroflexaceae bacterium]|nr:hypothetical protein [Chloroflexaceae bacterium]
MVREIEEQVVEFKLELDRIAQIMAPNLVIDPYHNREQSNQWARTLIGSVLRDIGAMQGSLIEWDDWSGIFWTIVQQLLLIYIASLFSGPIGWTIFALGQVVQYLWAEQQFKQRLLERIGDELHKNLQRELPAMQKQISQDVQHQFVRLAQRLNQALQDLIDEKHHELARILLQKRDASFSADREKERLTRIGQRLVRIRDSL